MAAAFLDRRTQPHVLTLVLAASVGALSMNIFLPSMPGMARHFEADYAVVQLAVSLYLVATAFLQLLIGPASDRFGRRPVMLVCMAIFLVGSVAAIYAPTIGFLLGCRLLQAFATAGIVLSRAIVRDTVEASEAASAIGYITMGMALVPMIGPMIGGVLDEIYGWQSTFVLTLAFGLVVVCPRPSRHRRDQPQPVGQFRRTVQHISRTADLAPLLGIRVYGRPHLRRLLRLHRRRSLCRVRDPHADAVAIRRLFRHHLGRLSLRQLPVRQAVDADRDQPHDADRQHDLRSRHAVVDRPVPRPATIIRCRCSGPPSSPASATV